MPLLVVGMLLLVAGKLLPVVGSAVVAGPFLAEVDTLAAEDILPEVVPFPVEEDTVHTVAGHILAEEGLLPEEDSTVAVPVVLEEDVADTAGVVVLVVDEVVEP